MVVQWHNIPQVCNDALLAMRGVGEVPGLRWSRTLVKNYQESVDEYIHINISIKNIK